MSETEIMSDIRKALNATGHVRVVRNAVGFDSDHKCRYGLGVGSPDLIGTLRGGRCFAVEVKTPRGRLSPEQAAWWHAASAWGVAGGVARSVPEALALLDAALTQDPGVS